MAVLEAAPISGDVPLSVAFDGSASYDPDGTVASYAWNFGDGSVGTGAICVHTYNQAGTFTATLTVTDNLGMQATATAQITVVDPTVVNAPSGLAASVSSKVVTLRWTDNAANETGFYVERALKPKKGAAVYARVATVPAGASSYSETLVAGTYYYRVQAFTTTTGQLSAYSNAATANVRGR